MLPDEPTPEQVYCYGRLAGFVAVAMHHYPDDPPTPGWVSTYLSGCVAVQESLDDPEEP
jgi:hypothetical protein